MLIGIPLTAIPQFNCLLVDEHLRCLQIGAIINETNANILDKPFCGHIFSFVLDKDLPRRETAGSEGRCIFNFIMKH